MTPSLFESKPRWPNAPIICEAKNLPAFKHEAEIKSYKAKRCPSSSVAHTYKCVDCGLLHVIWSKQYDN